MKRELIKTKDGSSTLYVPELNEHYHSVYGAITESVHVFIRSGLHAMKKESIDLVEIGFGTGLNALLTCLDALKNNIRVNYLAIEKYPLDKDIIGKLNYPEILNPGPESKKYFSLMHTAKSREKMKIHKYFSFTMIEEDILTFNIEHSYDLVYFDAFAPSVQPELWTSEVIGKIYAGHQPGGILTTYCAMGNVRRRLRDTGYKTERLPGPPGKREMLRARKLSPG